LTWIPLYQKIEEMRLAIEELEMLKELADELEEQHVDTEKAMQEDLGPSIMRASITHFPVC
jgi:dynactin 1